MIYSSYAMEWYFWLFGIGWVAGFFFLSVKFSQEWSIMRIRNQKAFEQKLFGAGLVMRTIYVIFMYFFYISMTGQAHEFQVADSASYIEVVEDWCMYWNKGILGTILATTASAKCVYLS